MKLILAAVLCVPIVILLIVWTAGDPLQALRDVNDPYRIRFESPI